MIRNKVRVVLFLEDGCRQENGEVNIRWQPVNFMVYSDLFIEIINAAIDEWLSGNDVGDKLHEVIFAHTTERDRAGAILGECFEPIYHEFSDQ